MKRFIKNNIFGFIIGVVLCASIIGVYALNAIDIDYKDTKVDQALDDLYTEVNKDLIDRLDLTSNFVYSVGYRTGPKTVSINVDSGSYLIVFTSGYGWNSGSWTPTIANGIEEVMNNNKCTSLIQKKLVNYTDGNANFTGTAVYKCKFTSSDTVSFSHNQTAATGMTENFLLYSIKID